MKRIIMLFITCKTFQNTMQLLCVSLTFMVMLLAQSAVAQDGGGKEKLALPYYLSDTDPDTHPTGFRKGACDLLDGEHVHSVAERFDTGAPGPYELRYQLPPGCTRFTASAGVDNKYPITNLKFSFTVWGTDANGVKKRLKEVEAYSGGKPQPIDVDVTGIHQLVLAVGCVNNEGRNVDCRYLCWADARLSKDGPPPLPPTLLVFDDNEKKQKLLELSQDLMKNFMGKELAVAPFRLESQADAPLDPKNAAAIQDSLRDALNQTKPTDLTSLKESYSGLLKDWNPGDDLSDAAKTELRKNIDQRYILLGTIADRKENALIKAVIYDLRTGKPIVEDESKVRIPIRDHQFPALPQAAGGGAGGVPGPPTNTVSARFISDKKLRVISYQWVVDGQTQPETKISGLNMVTLSIPSDKKIHKFRLVWTGQGFMYNDPIIKGRTITGYEEGNVNFETEVSEAMQIEISVKVRDQILSHNLEKKVKVNNITIPNK